MTMPSCTVDRTMHYYTNPSVHLNNPHSTFEPSELPPTRFDTVPPSLLPHLMFSAVLVARMVICYHAPHLHNFSTHGIREIVVWVVKIVESYDPRCAAVSGVL